MRQIVTGGAGFTGTYLCRALVARGERPIVFDVRPPSPAIASIVDFIRGDVCSKTDVAQLGLSPGDIVYHLAARQFHGPVPRRDRERWFAEVNVEGTKTVVRAVAAGGARDIVFFSTDMTYGRPTTVPVPPQHPQNPIGPYGRSKKAAERILIDGRGSFGLRSTIFRPRLIAGAGRLGILEKLFRLVRAGLPVPMIGTGRNRYQMVAVEDCVSAALKAVDLGLPSGPFNLGSDAPPTVRELLSALIARACSRSFVVPTPARLLQSTLAVFDAAGLPLLYPEQFAIANLDYILDTCSAKRELNWSPTRTDADILFDAFERWSANASK